jgi:hypothetical protein
LRVEVVAKRVSADQAGDGGAWHVVAKGVVGLLQTSPVTAVEPFQGWSPAGRRVVGHGGP